VWVCIWIKGSSSEGGGGNVHGVSVKPVKISGGFRAATLGKSAGLTIAEFRPVSGNCEFAVTIPVVGSRTNALVIARRSLNARVRSRHPCGAGGVHASWAAVAGLW